MFSSIDQYLTKNLKKIIEKSKLYYYKTNENDLDPIDGIMNLIQIFMKSDRIEQESYYKI